MIEAQPAYAGGNTATARRRSATSLKRPIKPTGWNPSSEGSMARPMCRGGIGRGYIILGIVMNCLAIGFRLSHHLDGDHDSFHVKDGVAPCSSPCKIHMSVPCRFGRMDADRLGGARLPRCVMPTTAQPSTNFRRLSRSSVTVDFPVGVTLNPLWDGVRQSHGARVG